jgi:hypothetical protein
MFDEWAGSERMMGIEGWQPDRKLLKIIEELKNEGRL